MTYLVNEEAGNIGYSLLTVSCIGCRRAYQFEVETSALRSWQNGASAQNAFPELDVDKRELLISGFCSTCFDEVTLPDD